MGVNDQFQDTICFLQEIRNVNGPKEWQTSSFERKQTGSDLGSFRDAFECAAKKEGCWTLVGNSFNTNTAGYYHKGIITSFVLYLYTTFQTVSFLTNVDRRCPLLGILLQD
ncbi:hypothetical protein Hanom_Chr17g01557701 [Helianthus anomalus]